MGNGFPCSDMMQNVFSALYQRRTQNKSDLTVNDTEDEVCCRESGLKWLLFWKAKVTQWFIWRQSRSSRPPTWTVPRLQLCTNQSTLKAFTACSLRPRLSFVLLMKDSRQTKGVFIWSLGWIFQMICTSGSSVVCCLTD